MTRKTIRVEFPRKNPDELLTLINMINTKSAELADNSPLDDEDIEALTRIYNEANAARKEAKSFEAQAQGKNQSARSLLGINNEQGAFSPSTGLYHVIQVRDTLLKKFRGNEEKLTEWGFLTVVGQAKSPKPREKKG